MRFLSVCSGIEAASVAWHPLGWQAAAFSEIDAFPSAVLATHYPNTPNLGDMTRFEEWPDLAIDLLVGGTPCQSFSVAGLRRGLADPRGNLMLVFGAIARRYRPRWVLWENVPGVLSSNGGRDFGAFLGMLGECGYGYAYRVLDAQYFGLAQRRKRVFVVAHSRDWRPAAAVLLERAGVRGDPAPRREARQGTAPTLSARTKGGGGLGTDAECDGALIAGTIGTTSHDPMRENVGEGLVAFAQNSRDEVRVQGDGQIVGALGAEPGMKQTTYLAFDARQSDVIQYGDKSDPLDTDGHSVAVAFGISGLRRGGSPNGGDLPTLMDTAPTLERNHHGQAGVLSSTVRRLTPRECERLQGFPDDYTLITYRKKPAADGPRYKALGNSFAVPVMRWIGERIERVERIMRETARAR